ncbi:MAG: hypothetical protein V4585_13095 [Bacteroidota bacterium]|jgi:antitoxin component of MazEF toxin-antitoxin module
MATYKFYDTEGRIVLSNIDADATALWGNAAAVRWHSIPQNQIIQLNAQNLLEVNVSNLLLISNTIFTHIFRNFTQAELLKRANVANIPSRESIAFRVVKEGQLAKFVFLIHADTIKSLTNNFSRGLMITLGANEGKIELILKSAPIAVAPVGNDVVFLNAQAPITNPSGGAKIP